MKRATGSDDKQISVLIWALCLLLMPLTVVPADGGVDVGFRGEMVGGSVDGVAMREIMRRQENVDMARSLVIQGDAAYSQAEYELAISKYRQALDLVPLTPITGELRAEIIHRYSTAAVTLAKIYADDGRYEEARAVVEGVLQPSNDPDNRAALVMLERLDDTERYEPARSREHMNKVREVQRLLRLGESYYLLGNYDSAEEQFFRVLTIDRYNTAARNFLSQVERTRMQYYGAAYKQTRASMMRMVDESWETQPPIEFLPQLAIDEINLDGGPDLRIISQNKLDTIEIDQIKFEGATLGEVVDYLRLKSRELDPTPGLTPEERGLNIIVRGPAEARLSERPIHDLELVNVPLGEVLRYVTELTGTRYRVEPFAVVVTTLTDDVTDIYVRQFRVPPDFIPVQTAEDGAADDIFAVAAGDPGTVAIGRRMPAKDYLETQGVPFPPNTGASYDPRSGTLTVRNTSGAMEMVEGIVERAILDQPKMISIETKFVEIAQDNTSELGFDWLLGPVSVQSGSGVQLSGGTTSGGIARLPGDFPFLDQTLPDGAEPLPFGRNPVTSGLRSGDYALSRTAIDSLLSADLATIDQSSVAPSIFGVAGLLTEPQFQMVMRGIDQKKGSDLLSAPTVTTRSGVPAMIEIIREFIYPTAYDPPQLPGTVGGFGGGGGGGIIIPPDPGDPGAPGAIQQAPITPSTPTAFEMRPTGVILEVEPVLSPDSLSIELNMSPEVVEFEGFVNYGSQITQPGRDGFGNPTRVIISENRIQMPIFSVRRVDTNVTAYDGQTVAIGGLIREDVQIVDDRVPLLGDLPLFGRFFRTEAETRFKRNLMVFVTARVIDPAGRLVNDFRIPTEQGEGIINPTFDRGMGGGITPSLFQD